MLGYFLKYSLIDISVIIPIPILKSERKNAADGGTSTALLMLWFKAIKKQVAADAIINSGIADLLFSLI
jgi:hypothetical protein